MAIFGRSYDHFLGYALSGGGAKGFAHLGALKMLEKCGLKPEVIVGTSAGSLAGVLYADGFHPDEIAEMFKKREFKEFVEFSIPKAGLLKSTGLHEFLKKNLKAKTFEDLKIPFYAIATDWNSAKATAFSKGDTLIDAVVASCSVPVVFNPQYINGTPYVDGGVLMNFPVSVIRNKCRYVLGINVTAIFPPAEKDNIISVMERTFNLMSNANTFYEKSICDILIEVEGIYKYKMFDLNNMSTISEIGYHQTAIKMSEKDSWDIIERCHRHYKRTEEFQRKLELLKQKMSHSSITNKI